LLADFASEVFAAGDVTGGPQFVSVAAAQGTIAAENAKAGSHRIMDYRELRASSSPPPLWPAPG
jgi:mercuric reductase